jgi:hypothetical protein
MSGSLIFTQLASDNFQRPNETPLSNGGKWSAIPAYNQSTGYVIPNSQPQGWNYLESHQVTQPDNFWYGLSCWLPTFPNDQYAEFTVAEANYGTYYGPLVRAQVTVGWSGYSLVATNFGPGASYIGIDKWVGGLSPPVSGPGISLISQQLVAFQNGDKIRISAVGPVGNVTVTAYVNGVAVLSVVDTDITYPYSGGMPGMLNTAYGGGGLAIDAISSWAAGSVTQMACSVAVAPGYQIENTAKRIHLYCQLIVSPANGAYPAGGIPLDSVLLALPEITTNSGVKWTDIRSDSGSGYIYVRIPSTGTMMILEVPQNGSLTTASPLWQISVTTNMQGIANDMITCHATFLRNA